MDEVDAVRRYMTWLYEADLISLGCYEALVTRDIANGDDLEQLLSDLLDSQLRRDFYKLVERIERGERVIAAEKDPHKLASYRKLMDKLITELGGKSR